MKRFSKALTFSLLFAVIFTAAAFGGGGTNYTPSAVASAMPGPHGTRYAVDQTLRTVYPVEVTNWSTFAASSSAADWSFVRQTFEGLMTSDLYQNIVPGMADSYTVSPDGLVYTFRLKRGLMYVNNLLQPVVEMTADDFVAVAEYVLNPDNAVISYIWNGIIKGAREYYNRETTDFSTVGYKAIDRYTLEVTLEQPSYYWIDTAGSYVGMPRSYIQQWGDQNGVDETKILSIGPYVLTVFQPQVRHVFVKNPYYYDRDKVYITRIEDTYNAEANTVAPQMFLRGETDYAEIDAGLIDQWKNNPGTGNLIISYPPGYDYPTYYSFCYDPKFGAEYQPENYKLAIDNEAFRQSLYWGLNRQRAARAYDPYDSADLNLAYIISGGEFLVDYNGKLLRDYDAFNNLKARGNWSFNAARALQYKQQAMTELRAQGVTFPIILYTRFNPVTTGWPQEVTLVTQQLTDLLGRDYVDFRVVEGPAVGFLDAVRRAGDWGFLKLNHGVNSSVRDPGFASILAFDGTPNNRWTFLQNATTPNVRRLHDQYLAMLERANSIQPMAGTPTFNADVEARFKVYAEAEAFLLEHAFVIPFHYWYDGYYVTRTFSYDSIGSSYKGRRVFADPLTSEQYALLYADWLAAKQRNAR
jgi:oligopeptide transport system substrate-binding protein